MLTRVWPKSAIFSTPPALSSRFDGLMSRWSRPCGGKRMGGGGGGGGDAGGIVKENLMSPFLRAQIYRITPGDKITLPPPETNFRRVLR